MFSLPRNSKKILWTPFIFSTLHSISFQFCSPPVEFTSSVPITLPSKLSKCIFICPPALDETLALKVVVASFGTEPKLAFATAIQSPLFISVTLRLILFTWLPGAVQSSVEIPEFQPIVSASFLVYGLRLAVCGTPFISASTTLIFPLS